MHFAENEEPSPPSFRQRHVVSAASVAFFGYDAAMILLETLPGWPEVEPLSALFYWLLFVIGPLAFGALITVLVFAKDWSKSE